MAALFMLVCTMQLTLLYDLYKHEDMDEEVEEVKDPAHLQPLELNGSFDVEMYTDDYCVQEFWFTCAQLKEILEALKVP